MMKLWLSFFLVTLLHLMQRSGSQKLSAHLTRIPKGVAANVAAAASTKTQRVPVPHTISSSSRPNSFLYDELPLTITNSQKWRGTYTAEEKLVAHLLSRGSLTVRPNGYNNISKNPVHVDITYNVIQILAFKWMDPRLHWDPNEYSDIHEVHVPSMNLWIPDVGVMNGKSSSDFDFSAGVRGRLTVSASGEVTWLHGAVLDTTCPLDVAFFPFDYQTCFLILTPWQSGERQLLLRPFRRGTIVDNSYLPNSNVSEWEIQSVHFASRKYSSDLNVTYQYVSIGIHLKRQPLYFVVLVLVPFSMLSALACLIFTLDDTGDRLSVALSLVLSMTMYVVIVSTNAPRSMRTLPVLGIFLLDQLGLLSIATVLAVINNKLYQATELVTWQDLVYAISGTGESKTSDTPHQQFGYNVCMGEGTDEELRMCRDKGQNVIRNQVYQDGDPGNRDWEYRNSFGFDDASGKMTNNYKSKKSHINKSLPTKRHNKCNANDDISHTVTSMKHHIDPSNDSTYYSNHRNNQSPLHGLNKPNNNNRISNRSNETWLDSTIKKPYPHHPLCNNINTQTSVIHNHYPNTHVVKSPRKPKNQSRSPWVEPLSSAMMASVLALTDDTESSPGLSMSQIDSDFDASPMRLGFHTTVTATAAAALAATRVLNAEHNFSVDDATAGHTARLRGHIGKQRGGDRRHQHHHSAGAGRDWLPDSRQSLSSYSSPEASFVESTTLRRSSINARLAASAVAAAFHAAQLVSSQERARHARSNNYRRSGQSSNGQKRHNRHNRCPMDVYRKNGVNKKLLYPYRELASRMDCIQMIAYLLLSSVNAIVCLVIMPRYAQDIHPPKNWVS